MRSLLVFLARSAGRRSREWVKGAGPNLPAEWHGTEHCTNRFLGRKGLLRRSELLGGDADDDAERHPGQDDLPERARLAGVLGVSLLRHVADGAREERADDDARDHAGLDRVELARRVARGEAGDEPLERRADHDADVL